MNGVLGSVGVVPDEPRLPAAPCATCGDRSFHRAPADRWRCSACEPARLPGDPARQAGWAFCALPLPYVPGPDTASASPGNAQEEGPAPGWPRAPASTGSLRASPRWTDDRGWLARWRAAGALADREAVARAWIAAAPPQPLPRRLATVELCRIAAQHGIEVEIEQEAWS